MNELLGSFKIKIPPRLFLKDPESSELGRSILRSGLSMMAAQGYESFTFKKLADAVGSPESSIYRYFENKHKLLLYLISFYWSWQEYRVVFAISNMNDSESRLTKAIEVLNTAPPEDAEYDNLPLMPLFRLAEQESAKVFLHQQAAEEEMLGLYIGYHRLANRFVKLVSDLNPDYKFPRALVSTLLDALQLQPFYARQLPQLSDATTDQRTQIEFLTHFVLANLKNA